MKLYQNKLLAIALLHFHEYDTYTKSSSIASVKKDMGGGGKEIIKGRYR